MNAEPLDRLERLFQAARLLPSEALPAFLDAACPDDPPLQQELRSLLEADRDADATRFLDTPVFDLRPEPADEAASAPEHVGPYTVLRRLGQGGMGEVFLALREEPFRRYVALKIIRPGLDSREVLARFRMERQILASLNHPHIAQLLDGGITETGLPYFAMEYVEGLPITQYCDAHRLPIEERLRLFQTVCQAVHYAHQNLVLHRDLKPSNILVTREGLPKLLDFGIAKLLNPNLGQQAMPVTRTELRLMTPEYASPEQVRAEALTTASDVYALGVLLYELLTGHRPYRLAQRTHAALIEAVCEQQPERPSTRVTKAETVELGEGRTEQVQPEQVAEARAVAVERLKRRLKGDLDNIVLMALRKEAVRRYASAEQLGEDVGRYLGGQPVVAQRLSRRYRVRKFVGRHRVGVGAAVLVVVSLLGGVGVSLWQARQAQQARLHAEDAQAETAEALQQSEAVTGFLISLFEASDPLEAQGDTITARQLMERGLQRAEALDGQPGVQAQMLDAIGRVYQSLGQYDQAQPLLERALALRRATFGPSHPDVARSLQHVGFLLHLKGEYDAAETFARDALAQQRAHYPGGHVDIAESLNLLAATLRRKGDYAAAEPLYREALAMRRHLLGEEHPDVATSRNNLALLLRLQGSYDEAEMHLREAIPQWRRTLGETHPYVAAGLTSLGTVLFEKGDYAGAEANYREALALRQHILGNDHPDVARSMSRLATALRRMGEMAEAEVLYRQALAIQHRHLGEHAEVAQTMTDMALLLQLQKAYAEAEALNRAALAMRRRLLGAQHPDVAASLKNLAMLVQEQGDPDAAAAYYDEALAIQRAALGPDHPDVAKNLIHVASLYRQQGAYAQAEAAYEEALAIFREHFPEDHMWIQVVYKGYAKLYDAWGRPEDAGRYWSLLPAESLVHADSTS